MKKKGDEHRIFFFFFVKNFLPPFCLYVLCLVDRPFFANFWDFFFSLTLAKYLVLYSQKKIPFPLLLSLKDFPPQSASLVHSANRRHVFASQFTACVMRTSSADSGVTHLSFFPSPPGTKKLTRRVLCFKKWQTTMASISV